MPSSANADLATAVAANVPYLRRYARALTGDQTTGDRYASAALEALLNDGGETADMPVRARLFRAFHVVWSSSGAPVGEPDSALSARAHQHMANLTPNAREALLLHVVEGITLPEVAQILGISPTEAEVLVRIARREMERAIAGKVMIIEDEAIIAMDIAAIVEEAGHRVTGVARTRREAVRLAEAEPPDLILADIQLADNSSGIDAVNDILAKFEDIPVVFITAFPERLLTGRRPEPAFLIAKQFSEDQLRSAVGQAMFFASTETLFAEAKARKAGRV